MTERREIQIPVWCSALCRNAYNEKCVTECSVNRDCSYFEEMPGLKLGDMPRFPDTKELETAQEKFTAVTVYVSKIVDHLQGNEAEPNQLIFHGTTRIAGVYESLKSKEQK